MYRHLCVDVGLDSCDCFLGRTWPGSLVGHYDYHSVLVVVLLHFVVYPLCAADGVADVWELLGARAGWVAWMSLGGREGGREGRNGLCIGSDSDFIYKD